MKIHEKNNVASTGSLTRSTLLISTKGSENGPDLPKTLLYFCNIKVNETTILITGGIGGRSKSTFQNMVTGQSVPGPRLQKPRSNHVCGAFEFKGISLALVADGGGTSSDNIEVLDLSDVKQGGWMKIPTNSLPGRKGSFQIVVLNRTDVYALGGGSDGIFKLKCREDLQRCEWTRMKQSLKEHRRDYAAFAIPDSVADELCNKK